MGNHFAADARDVAGSEMFNCAHNQSGPYVHCECWLANATTATMLLPESHLPEAHLHFVTGGLLMESIGVLAFP